MTAACPWRAAVALAAACGAAACGFGETFRGPQPLRVGLIAPIDVRVPDSDSPRYLRDRFAPVDTYLDAALGRPVDVAGMRDPMALTAAFEAGRFDVAFLGAAHFAHAREHGGAVPLVVRDSDRNVTAMFLAAPGDTRTTLQEFRGARLSFGPRFSSSHIMARHYLEKQGIVPEEFFGEVAYAPAADDTALLVGAGRYDLIATGGAAVSQLMESGGLRGGQIRIVWETPPYVTSVWAASPRLSADLLDRIRDAFLALSADNPAHAPVLAALSATAFVPASLDDYADLTALMRRMNMFGPELVQPGAGQ